MTLFRTRKPLPFVFMVVSILYFIYVISLGSSTMIGDEIGGDPGGMMLPLVLSIFMFVASTILFLTDKKPQETDKKSQEAAQNNRGTSEQRLFLLTLIVAILYVAAMRPLGFIITTAMLVFTLTFFYLQGTVVRKDVATWAVGTVATLAVLLALYSIGRVISRYLLLSARQGRIPQWLGSTGVVLVIVLVLYYLLYKLTRARFHHERVPVAVSHAFDACMISAITTELIYLVFRQMFLVELVPGLITW